MKILILTGVSGAGKGVALRCLEDLGYYCVDNLLPILIPKFIDLALQSDGKIGNVALVVDIREENYFHDIFTVLQYLTEHRLDYHSVFLDARDEVIVKRYQETRRRHPLADRCPSLPAAVAEERRLLEEIKGKADIVIDTSDFTLPAIRHEITTRFRLDRKSSPLELHLLSFGYKHGLPPELDLCFDVRFLPNPYYISRFKDLDGLHPEVSEYVCKWPDATTFLEQLIAFCAALLPYYVREERAALTIGIGCTGGRHRSVVVAGKLAAALQERFPRLEHRLEHRDVSKR